MIARRPLIAMLAIPLLLGISACSNTPARDADGPRTRALLDAATAPGTGEDDFATSGGIMLHERWWRPQGEPKAVLAIIHGLKDHGARYAPLAETLTAQGIAVYAMDLRGHGRSGGERVWVSSFEDYIDDAMRFLDRVGQREPGRPLFLFGHSMGGQIATRLVIERPLQLVPDDPRNGWHGRIVFWEWHPPLRGLILSAPALHADASGILIASTKATAGIAPHLHVFQLDAAGFSRDPAVVRDVAEADPLIDHGAAPANTAAELLRSIDWTSERLEDVSLTLPLLILHGQADRIVPIDGSRELLARARSHDKTLHELPDLYHDILHEPGGEALPGEIAAWILERAKAK